MSNKKPCICSVINQPLINPYGNQIEPLLHLICSDSFSEIIQFIFYVSESLSVFTIQDDDGNTPFHLLCKRINLLETNYSDYLNYNNGRQVSVFDNISFQPSLTKALELLKYLSNFIDFSIKNKEKKRMDEFHNNIILSNICFLQLFKKKQRNFPSAKPRNNYYDRISFIPEWNELFKLKNPKDKNRTLLHYLFMGDRLGAIKFLVDQGADVNNRRKIIDGYGRITYGPTALSKLFEEKSFNYKYDNYNTISIKIRVPAGFKKIPEIKSGWPTDYSRLLQPREKRILEETEKIALFFIEKCSDTIIQNGIPYCDYTDAMYKAYLEKDKPKKICIIELFKKVSNKLMICSCLPYGNYDNHTYNNSHNKVKYIKLDPVIDQDPEELENNKTKTTC